MLELSNVTARPEHYGRAQKQSLASAAGRNLDYLVFHSVLVGLKAEGKLPAETFLNSLRSVWLKLPPSDGINRNSNDEWMPRYPLHADDISLRVNKNRQDNGSTYVKHIRAAWSLNRLCLFHQSPYFWLR